MYILIISDIFFILAIEVVKNAKKWWVVFVKPHLRTIAVCPRRQCWRDASRKCHVPPCHSILCQRKLDERKQVQREKCSKINTFFNPFSLFWTKRKPFADSPNLRQAACGFDVSDCREVPAGGSCAVHCKAPFFVGPSSQAFCPSANTNPNQMYLGFQV